MKPDLLSVPEVSPLNFPALKSILDAAGTMIVACDADGIVRFFNPAAERLLGWRADEVVGIQTPAIWHVPAEVASRVAELSHKLGRTVQPGQDFLGTMCLDTNSEPCEWTLVRKDGSTFPAQLSVSAMRDSSGRITGYVATAQELTDRVRVEDALRRGEQNLAITLDAIGDAVIATDAARRVTRMNPVAEQMTGWTQSEAAGQPIDEVFHIVNEETRRRAILPEDAVLESGVIQSLANHTVLLSRDGTEWPISDCAAPIFGTAGQIVGVVLVFRDATEERGFKRTIQTLNADLERRVEERTAELAESERFNRATLDALSAHVAVLDATGTIVATNRAWREFSQTNGSAYQMVGEGTNYLAICDRAAASGDPDAAATAHAIRRVLVGEQETWMHEYPCHSADKQRWFYCRVTRFPGEGAVHVVVSHENITPMKLALEQLESARARFETLDRVSPVAILFFDRVGNCVDANDRWCEMSGISRQAAHGAGWNSVVHPDDLQRVTQKWSEAVRDGAPVHSEYRILRPSGAILWLVSQGVPIRDSKGNVSGFIRVSIDLTEQKQTEQALRLLSSDLALLRGNAFYEAAVTHLAELLNCDMAFICRRDSAQSDQLVTLAIHADGKILPNFSYPITGTPCEDVMDRQSCVIPSGVQQKYPQDVFLIDHQIEAYVGVPFIDGKCRQIGHLGVMSRKPLTNPQNIEAITKLFSVAVISEIERHASERRFTDLFEFSPDAIVITNRDGQIVQANRQVAAIFGWTPAELEGQPVEVLIPANLRANHPSLRERYVNSALPRAMGGGRDDLLGLRKNGSVFPVDISLSPMQTSEGLLVAAAVRDATERQNVLREFQSVAEELRAANSIIEQERSHLADRVAERTAELTAANEELIQASRVKSEFLASMSHELRTPLNGVLGMNELLLKTPLTDKQREFIDASNSSGRALLSLINDVLDISKIEAGKIELDIRICDLEALVYDVITMFSHRAKQKGISLSCRLDPETCVTVMCDDTRVRQILVNLLGNALKFTASGSVILETTCVRRDERRIVVQFAVSDTGQGIPDEKLHHLFSPFSQVDSSTARHFGGTGLGLSITKQLVEMMGGTVGVTSRLGIGSTFWIDLPFELVHSEVRAVKRRQRLEGTKVLVVNGVENERRQIAICLKDWGCPYEYVGTLREAIDAVAKAETTIQPIDVVLAECSLAVGDEFGYLQKLARRRYPPVIGLGISESNDIANLLHLFGLRHLLDDPIRPSALFNALTSLLAVTPSTANPGPTPNTAVDEQATTFSGHILVAEDNNINQMFVRELLKHCGCTCDIANNGDEALTAMQQKHYDLVLMDCQMPEMDGFTASREIRRRESARELPGHVPIIALTANALKGDRELCLDAGMDDYLSKPLQAGQLQTMLAKYLTPHFAQPTP